MMFAMTQQGAILAGSGATGSSSVSAGYLFEAKLKLINSSSITLNPSTTWGSVSASIGGYDGYADGSLTFGAPSQADAGNIEVVSNLTIFRPTDSTNPQSMWGAVITDLGSSSVLFAAPFDDPPLPMNSALDQIQMSIRYNPAQPGTSLASVLS
jgi:hypothetical protein